MLGCAFNTVNETGTGLMGAAEADAVAAVEVAVDAGIHDLDVSASYGAGLSEEYVGSGLIAADIPSGPSWVSVWTKGGPELIRQADDTTKPVTRGYTGDRVNLRDLCDFHCFSLFFSTVFPTVFFHFFPHCFPAPPRELAPPSRRAPPGLALSGSLASASTIRTRTTLTPRCP